MRCFIVVGGDGGDCSGDIGIAAASAAAIGVSPSLFFYPSEHQLLHFFHFFFCNVTYQLILLLFSFDFYSFPVFFLTRHFSPLLIFSQQNFRSNFPIFLLV